CSRNAATHPIHCDHCQQTKKRRSQSRGRFRAAAETEGGHHDPVKESGLFKPGMATECGSDQISALKHLARYLRIARLIWSEKRKGTKPVEINDDDGEKE